MTKWHADVVHMAKPMKMVRGPGLLAPLKSGAAYTQGSRTHDCSKDKFGQIN